MIVDRMYTGVGEAAKEAFLDVLVERVYEKSCRTSFGSAMSSVD